MTRCFVLPYQSQCKSGRTESISGEPVANPRTSAASSTCSSPFDEAVNWRYGRSGLVCQTANPLLSPSFFEDSLAMRASKGKCACGAARLFASSTA